MSEEIEKHRILNIGQLIALLRQYPQHYEVRISTQGQPEVEYDTLECSLESGCVEDEVDYDGTYYPGFITLLIDGDIQAIKPPVTLASMISQEELEKSLNGPA